MPRKSNVPYPKNTDWKLVICPICGEECWEADETRKLIQNEGMKAACTQCAFKAGIEAQIAGGGINNE
ncbi:MAG: hypothetical protein WCS30_00155 [Selenomonadaceae bacterium]